MALFRIDTGDGVARLAVGDPTAGPISYLPVGLTLAGLLREGAGALHDAHRAGGDEPVPSGARLLAPVDEQEVWASGVTYLRSRVARLEESKNSAYDLVYDAQRPELFFKSQPSAVRAPGETVGIRADSTWDVPEPELTLVMDATGEIAAYTIGNDMSSRSIEGENTLYLPQAKTYRHSCAIGPCLVLPDELDDPARLGVGLVIERDGAVVFDGSSSTAEMKRRLVELRDWLFVANEFPDGVMLMTGTGIIPDSPFTLQAGDVVHISIEGLGRLTNTVEVVGAAAPGGQA
jgi:2-dehydro-3-deoxy-D-arabinonate dehydratase